jgi:rSAM/selenodomain-associated transferase 1
MKLNNEIPASAGKNVVIAFTRNPEIGKVKTRLAKHIGNEAALDVYKLLLQHTEQVLRAVNCTTAVYYSDEITRNDIWDDATYTKYVQDGEDLGQRMCNAFEEQFNLKYDNVVIVGSDVFDLKPQHINQAFEALEQNDAVIGPAKDGGYYLLGMKQLISQVFRNKSWGTETVFQDTVKDLQTYKFKILETLNDIDTFEDLEAHPTIINKISKKINEKLY